MLGNADAFSRVMDDHQVADAETDMPDIINAIQFRASEDESNDQLQDAELRCLRDLKRKAKDRGVERVSVADFENSEQRSLFTQWSRIQLICGYLYRE